MDTLELPFKEAPPPPSSYELRRFSVDGTVIVRGDQSSVFLGGFLLGEFGKQDHDRGRRNILVVTLAKSQVVHLGRLAVAFGITEEYLRRLRRMEEANGLGALLLSKQGKDSTVPPERRAEWCAMFAAGHMPTATSRAQRGAKRTHFSYTTVRREFVAWQYAQTRDAAPPAAPPVAIASPPGDDQLPLLVVEPATVQVVEPATVQVVEAAASDAHPVDAATLATGSAEIVPMTTAPVRGGQVVQHVGCWLLLALANEAGLYADADYAFTPARAHAGLRIALDAVLCALALGQRCVEGVRRLATPTGPTLLRADGVPTAPGVRKLFGRLLAASEIGGAVLEARTATRLIAAAHVDDGPAIFYADGHMRRYTGKHVVRKGWRMQDRRVLPGTTDYYCHDEAGRPVFRIPVTSHDSLTTWLSPIARRLREGLGEDERILVAFDRGGAFAQQLAQLRDAGVEFVTYERAPYPPIVATAFDRAVVVRGDTYQLHERHRKNLGDKRGRVRRIALRTPEGKQINLVAISTAPAEQLVAILLGAAAPKLPSGRWQQENAFHHGDTRWGINQLDDRVVQPYAPGTIIPNPARRQLDRSLRLARAAEGDARRKLASTQPVLGPLRRATVTQDLADAMELQRDLEALRPATPPRAPIEQTSLAGKLVRHTAQLKLVVDVLRIVCANLEADLAAVLALHLGRPREAKKVLANLFAAPGKVTVTDLSIRVRLAPAANPSERAAIEHFFTAINQRALVLPSDPKRLPLRFELQPL